MSVNDINYIEKMVYFPKVPVARNLIDGMKKTEQIVDKYKDFTQVVHYPDGSVRFLPFSIAVNKFLESKTDNLDYLISSEISFNDKEIRIHIIPKVESA